MLYDTPSDFELEIRQQPQHAKLAMGTKEKDRKPIDPPPIIQLRVSPRADPAQSYLQSPYLFMACSLLPEHDKEDTPATNSLIGTVVSSLHKLKDANNIDGGFFIFGDLSVKIEGRFKLQFSLYQMRDVHCQLVASTTSSPFTVYPVKSFPGLQESTFLTRSFSDQGVRIRLRKDSRPMSTKKRNASAADLSRRAGGIERTSSRDGMSAGRGYPSPTGSGGYDAHGGYHPYDDHTGKRARIDSTQAYMQEMSPYARQPSHYSTTMASAPSSYPMSLHSHSPYNNHGLNRLDTHLPPHGGPPSAGGSFQSPASRHSPAHYAFSGGLHASPVTTGPYPHSGIPTTAAHPMSAGADYRGHAAGLYTNGPGTEASPRNMPTPTHGQTPTSGNNSPDPNYTATSAPHYGLPSMVGSYQYPTGPIPPSGLPAPSLTPRQNDIPAIDQSGNNLGLDVNYYKPEDPSAPRMG